MCSCKLTVYQLWLRNNSDSEDDVWLSAEPCCQAKAVSPQQNCLYSTWLGGLHSEHIVSNNSVNPSFFALAMGSASFPIWYVAAAVTNFFLQVIFSHSMQQESAAARVIVQHGPAWLLD